MRNRATAAVPKPASDDFPFDGPLPDNRKHFIRVGEEYQAELPDCLSLPYPEETESEREETLLWAPLPEIDVIASLPYPEETESEREEPLLWAPLPETDVITGLPYPEETDSEREEPLLWAPLPETDVITGLPYPEETESEREEPLLWAPLPETDVITVDRYLKYAQETEMTNCTNKEKALHLLHYAMGDTNEATEMLTSSTGPQLPAGHAMTNYTYSECHGWSQEDLHAFLASYKLNGKQFNKISQDVKTKTSRECIQFYYTFKKIYKPKSLRKRRRVAATPVEQTLMNTRSMLKRSMRNRPMGSEQQVDGAVASTSSEEMPAAPKEHNFYCEDCRVGFYSSFGFQNHLASHRKKPKKQKKEYNTPETKNAISFGECSSSQPQSESSEASSSSLDDMPAPRLDDRPNQQADVAVASTSSEEMPAAPKEHNFYCEDCRVGFYSSFGFQNHLASHRKKPKKQKMEYNTPETKNAISFGDCSSSQPQSESSEASSSSLDDMPAPRIDDRPNERVTKGGRNSNMAKDKKKPQPGPSTPVQKKMKMSTPATCPMSEPSRETQFPCAKCYRIFATVKSRNAHMRCHKVAKTV